MNTATVYTVWMLACPECGSITELGDNDPCEKEQCEECGEWFLTERVG